MPALGYPEPRNGFGLNELLGGGTGSSRTSVADVLGKWLADVPYDLSGSPIGDEFNV